MSSLNFRFAARLQKKTSVLIAKGFSLVELLLYSIISLMLIGAAVSIAVSESISSIKTYELVALRNQIASVTFLLEGEIGEGESISVCSASCIVNTGTVGTPVNLSVPYSLVITHPYAVTGAGRNTATISYYGKTNDPNLYRFGPPFTTATTSVDPVSGKLGYGSGALDTGAASAETVASPNTSLSSMSINEEEKHTLTYSITITSGTTDRSSAWASTLSATGLKVRTRVFLF
jgi:hypothetical protein